ncbi:hypothetical protein V6Z12_A13G102700 [Gossypium hirsutum]
MFFIIWAFGSHKSGSVLIQTPQVNHEAEERSYVRFASIQGSYKGLLRKIGRFTRVLRESKKIRCGS